MLDNELPAKSLGEDAKTELRKIFLGTAQDPVNANQVTIEEQLPNYERLRVFSNKAATPVVISETYFPGWEALVDGHQVPLYMADGIIRGIMVTGSGNHVVELRYRPASFYWGGLISLGFMGMLLLWWIQIK